MTVLPRHRVNLLEENSIDSPSLCFHPRFSLIFPLYKLGRINSSISHLPGVVGTRGVIRCFGLFPDSFRMSQSTLVDGIAGYISFRSWPAVRLLMNGTGSRVNGVLLFLIRSVYVVYHTHPISHNTNVPLIMLCLKIAGGSIFSRCAVSQSISNVSPFLGGRGL